MNTTDRAFALLALAALASAFTTVVLATVTATPWALYLVPVFLGAGFALAMRAFVEPDHDAEADALEADLNQTDH